MPYINAGQTDPEFPRAAEQLNVRGGGSWIQAAEHRYGTPLEGFVEDNKSLIVIGLLGIAAFVMYKKELAPKKRTNPRRGDGGSKKFKVEVYGGPAPGVYKSYWPTRSAAAKEFEAVKSMKFGKQKMFEKRGGQWVGVIA